jgi:hypothetical protein
MILQTVILTENADDVEKIAMGMTVDDVGLPHGQIGLLSR